MTCFRCPFPIGAVWGDNRNVRSGGGLPDFLNAVRRRCTLSLVLDQFVHSAMVALGGAIVLLVVGTQIFEWYWVFLLSAASLCIGTYRTIRRAPSLYRTAQQVDARLELKDALSTAYFFSTLSRKASPDVVEAQFRAAEHLATGVDLRTAAPLAAPRRVWALALLGMVAFAMLGVRYGVRRSLDLRPPIAQVVFNILHGQTPLLALQKKDDPRQQKMPPVDQIGMALDRQGEQARSAGDTPQNAYSLENADAKSSQNEKQGGAKDKADNGSSDDEAAEQGEGADSTESAPNSEGASAPQDQQGPSQPNSAKGNQPKQGGKQNQPGENSSMLDKMRDAMANLLNKLNIKPKAEGTQQASNSQQGSPSGQRQQAGQRGQKSGKSQQQQQGSPNGEQSEQEGEGAERSQMAQGHPGQQGSDSQAPQDSKSGIGKNDGSKDLRDAEQLAAMGKLSEIIGKRAQNVTGEMMVEVAGGKQQLKTPYAQRNAAHADTGGEVNRDEVPLELQSFVQQYFHEIRKPQNQPPAKK